MCREATSVRSPQTSAPNTGYPGGPVVNDLKPLNDLELLREYINQAVWYWFEPSTHEMSLKAGFHRLAARCLLIEMRERGIDEPTDEIIFHRARKLFPRDD